MTAERIPTADDYPRLSKTALRREARRLRKLGLHDHAAALDLCARWASTGLILEVEEQPRRLLRP